MSVCSTFSRRACIAAAFALASTLPAFAAAPQVKTQAPGYYRVMLGDFEVTALSDGTTELPFDKLLHNPPAKTAAALKKAHLGSPVETSFNSFLINTGTKLVLVDTGAGGLFGPSLGKTVANLRAAGYAPDQVDAIVITHLHPDHVGGATADAAAVFTNATVHVDRRDADFWLSQSNLDAAPADTKGFFQGAIASLAPYVGSGRFEPFAGDHEIVPGVRSVSAYGHTPGHTTYTVESRGQKLVLIGDLIHLGAVQFDHPEVTLAFDSDAPKAARARQKAFTQAITDDALVGAAHLPFPGLGHLSRDGKGYRWIPVNYTTQLK